jgi:C-terminal processing protease CtpA/Prc
MLQYPFQDYITINGLRLEGNGVVPDIETKGMPTFGNDPGVNAAVKFLVEKAYISKKAS